MKDVCPWMGIRLSAITQLFLGDTDFACLFSDFYFWARFDGKMGVAGCRYEAGATQLNLGPLGRPFCSRVKSPRLLKKHWYIH